MGENTSLECSQIVSYEFLMEGDNWLPKPFDIHMHAMTSMFLTCKYHMHEN